MFARTVVAGAVLAALLAAAPARAATSAQIIRTLSQERAADGIPPVVEDPALSQACQAHTAYLADNAPFRGDPHEEIRGRPGYTSAGAAVAPISDLALGAYWDHGDPYRHSPFHLLDLLNPAMRVSGAADAHGWNCVAVADARRRRRPARFFTSPRTGRTGVPRSDYEEEEPYAPGELFGVPQDSPVGPHLYVFHLPADDPLTLRRASLRGPDGAVKVHAVDATKAAPVPPSAAIVFPEHPVPPGLYCARIVFRSLNGLRLRHRWWFATEGAPAPVGAPGGCGPVAPARLRISTLRIERGRIRAVVSRNRRVRGRLVVDANRGAATRRLHATKTTVRHGARRTTYTGRLPHALFRYLQVYVTLRRTDGGSDVAKYRNRRL